MKCRICNNNEGNKTFEIREMMFGSRDEFKYFQCSRCHCLQIAEIPQDLHRYYPPDYYSYFSHTVSNTGFIKRIKKFARKQRDFYALFNRGAAGKFIYKFFPEEPLRILSKLNLSKDESILDVGCGHGCILYSLKNNGFNNLLGIDKYINGDIEYENGLKIQKKSIHDVKGNWNLIMFNHSFEHFPEPQQTLNIVSKLLVENGTCLIRIPIISSWAWRHYGANWVQIDAPRHLFLHSIESIETMAHKAGLVSEKTIYDSNEFQFWGSEQYKENIPLNDVRSYKVNPANSIFSRKDIAEFKLKAKELNLKKQGDSASFFLRKF